MQGVIQTASSHVYEMFVYQLVTCHKLEFMCTSLHTEVPMLINKKVEVVLAYIGRILSLFFFFFSFPLTLSMLENKSEKPTVAVIGAGFVCPCVVVSESRLLIWILTYSASGICTYIELEKKLGIQASLFEMEDDLGGTWRQNTYPYASCDVPSHVYSLRSDLNPSKSCW